MANFKCVKVSLPDFNQTLSCVPRVMVFKAIPDVYGKHLNSEIGSPCDYQKNKENDSFPSSYDLRVPSAKTDDFDDNDLVGALDGFALDSTEERKG